MKSISKNLRTYFLLFFGKEEANNAIGKYMREK